MTTALLFDLDGTFADTEAEHFAAFVEVFGDLGIALTEDEYRTGIMGYSGHAIAARFLAHLTIDAGMAVMNRKEEVYRGRVGSAKAAPGALDLLDNADDRGIKYALVTNAPMANAIAVLEAIGVRRRFATIVSGAELQKSKPHPLPYLTALEHLGARAERSIAFEDAGSGARAAVAAGIPLVGLTTSLAAETLIGLGATLAAENFTDRRIHELLERQLSG